MPAYTVVRAGEVGFASISAGVESAQLIGAEDGAVHLDVSLVRIAPGAAVEAHVHPFEESFYVLEGSGVYAVAERSYEVRPASWGYAPIRTPHAWRNHGDEPMLLLRTRSPQARSIGEGRGSYPVEAPLTSAPSSPDDADRARRFVGQYSDDQMPTPGPIQMKGLRSAAARNVAVWMLVDEVVGAVHHTKFVVRFDPTGGDLTLGGQHMHPFEETYYITHGRATTHLEDESFEVGPGDLVFAGVNAFHGFTNLGSEPVRWIEMQAPAPPISDAFTFRAEWESAR